MRTAACHRRRQTRPWTPSCRSRLSAFTSTGVYICDLRTCLSAVSAQKTVCVQQLWAFKAQQGRADSALPCWATAEHSCFVSARGGCQDHICNLGAAVLMSKLPCT